jgi:hypothetical protein
VDQRDVVVAAEQADDLLALAQPHQAVVDEHAGQLVADRFVDEHGGDAESTPPESPQMTRPLPTCARISSILVLRNSAMVQSPAKAADMAHEVLEQLGAVGRVDHFGVELHRIDARSSSAMTAKGAPALAATGRKPGASLVTLSPWLIHTWWVSPSATGRRTARSDR